MADPFLFAHQVGPRTFSIGGGISPVSIRDQMVRAEMFVERAWNEGLLTDHRKRPLLIFGAGAGGATAALHAAETLGVTTILADREDVPFRLQLDCPTRWLDPTAYDFPVDHWRMGCYPPVGSHAPPRLAWSANWAHLTAIHWQSLFFPAAHGGGPLEFRPQTEITGLPVVDSMGSFATVPVRERGRSGSIDCALVLLATGVGREKTFLLDALAQPGPTRGFSFWNEDPLGNADFGLTNGMTPSILVSGAGDGALQDFLRLTTACRSPEEIYRAVPLDDRELSLMHSAQRRAERMLAWGSSPHTDHEALSTLHEAVQRMVAEKLHREGVSIRRNFEPLLRQPMPNITMTFPCSHFANCYALNHYLTLLVANLAAEELGRPVLRPRRRVSRIDGMNGHVCQGNPSRCHGQWHEVEWVTVDDCRGGASSPSGVEHANIVILRHGVHVNPIAANLLPPVRRHLLPYFLPK